MRLPITPLLERIQGTTPQQAKQLGVHLRTLQRWQKQGIPVDSADKAAIHIGSHPIIIWGTQWENQ